MTIFIQKGDEPMSYRQAVKRGLRMFDAQLAQWQREQGLFTESPGYAAWAQDWLLDNQVNEANNVFNHQLAAYRDALARLAMSTAAAGREAVTELQPTGEVDSETGEPIMAEVIVSPAVDALPAMIEVPTYDAKTGEPTGPEEIPNPDIVRDEAERDEAQQLISAMPEEIIHFDEFSGGSND